MLLELRASAPERAALGLRASVHSPSSDSYVTLYYSTIRNMVKYKSQIRERSPAFYWFWNWMLGVIFTSNLPPNESTSLNRTIIYQPTNDTGNFLATDISYVTLYYTYVKLYMKQSADAPLHLIDLEVECLELYLHRKYLLMSRNR